MARKGKAASISGNGRQAKSASLNPEELAGTFALIAFPVRINLLILLAREGKLRPVEIGKRLGVKQPNMGGILRLMQYAGLLDRRPDPDDGRIVYCYGTTAAFAGQLRALADALTPELPGTNDKEI